MGVLSQLALALALVGCYSPDLADCAVSCASDADCGGGQRCSPQGLCAAASATCPDGVDAAATEPDAATPDTPPPQTMLRVRIADMGSVTLAPLPPCLMECTYTVDSGVELMLVAEPLPDRIFEKWDEACAGQPTRTCVLTPSGAETKVTAKFRREP